MSADPFFALYDVERQKYIAKQDRPGHQRHVYSHDLLVALQHSGWSRNPNLNVMCDCVLHQKERPVPKNRYLQSLQQPQVLVERQPSLPHLQTQAHGPQPSDESANKTHEKLASCPKPNPRPKPHPKPSPKEIPSPSLLLYMDFTPERASQLLSAWGKELKMTQDFCACQNADRLWNTLEDLKLEQPPKKVKALRKNAQKYFTDIQKYLVAQQRQRNCEQLQLQEEPEAAGCQDSDPVDWNTVSIWQAPHNSQHPSADLSHHSSSTVAADSAPPREARSTAPRLASWDVHYITPQRLPDQGISAHQARHGIERNVLMARVTASMAECDESEGQPYLRREKPKGGLEQYLERQCAT